MTIAANEKQQSHSHPLSIFLPNTSSSSDNITTYFLSGFQRANLLTLAPLLLLSTDATIKNYAILLTNNIFATMLGSFLHSKSYFVRTKMEQHVGKCWGFVFALYLFGFVKEDAKRIKLLWFFSSTILGCLLGSNDETQPWKSMFNGSFPSKDEDEKKKKSMVQISKLYLYGFICACMFNLLFYSTLTNSSLFQKMIGGNLFLSLIFFGVTVICVEKSLQFLAVKILKKDEHLTHGGNKKAEKLAKSPATKKSEKSSVLRRRHMAVDIEEGNQDTRHRDYPSTENKKQPPLSPEAECSEDEDIFFDCEVYSDDDLENQLTQPTSTTTKDTKNNDEERHVSKYVDGKHVYPTNNNKPSYVPTGNTRAKIPPNFLHFHNHDTSAALTAYKATQKFRKSEKIWKVHTRPHPFFHQIKKAYPHFIHGYSKAGHPIVYEQPGKMNLKSLFRDSDCKIEDMVHHYTFFQEFIQNVVCHRPDVRSNIDNVLRNENKEDLVGYDVGSVVVMDIKGASPATLSVDVLRYLKASGEINNSHYPLNLKRAVIANIPFWLAGSYGYAKQLLPDSVLVSMLSSSKTAAEGGLREFVDDDQIPKEYGGSSEYKLGEHPLELEICKLGSEAAGRTSEEEDVEDDDEDFMDGGEADIEEGAAPSSNLSEFQSEGHGLGVQQRGGVKPQNEEESHHLLAESQQQPEPSSTTSTSSLLPKANCTIFFVTSTMRLTWCAVEKSIDLFLPLYMVMPPSSSSTTTSDSIGYASSASIFLGASISSLFLLIIFPVATTRVTSDIPKEEPLRAFRIGAGTTAILMCILPFLPSPEQKSTLAIMCTVMVLSTLILSKLLVHFASIVLHRRASKSFSEHGNVPSFLSAIYSRERFVQDCQSERATTYLSIIGEIMGIIITASLYKRSIGDVHSLSINGSSYCFFATSCICLSLYILSFALFVNDKGEFAPHPPHTYCGGGGVTNITNNNNVVVQISGPSAIIVGWFVFLGEVLSAAACDVSYLINEMNVGGFAARRRVSSRTAGGGRDMTRSSSAAKIV